MAASGRHAAEPSPQPSPYNYIEDDRNRLIGSSKSLGGGHTVVHATFHRQATGLEYSVPPLAACGCPSVGTTGSRAGGLERRRLGV